jgi:hypothetical protein
MSRDERKDLIERIERERNSKVVCYITGDRNPFPAQIGDDAVRPLYQHIRDLGKTSRLDLFLYSRGGAIDVPWRIVSALRSASEDSAHSHEVQQVQAARQKRLEAKNCLHSF